MGDRTDQHDEIWNETRRYPTAVRERYPIPPTILITMHKYQFYNDYSEGAHPEILKALEAYNDGQEVGYGEDHVSKEAASLIRETIGNSEAKISFVSGGTQANLVVLSSLLKPYESVIAPITGHIHVHEAGAIEATGHKIEAIPTPDGKLTPSMIQKVVADAMPVHMTKPKAVFISNSTEVGTVYTKRELEMISSYCHENDLYVYLDGARLGTALTSPTNDLQWQDIARLVDVFYIGGTKNGAMMGEAIVIPNRKLQEHFDFHLKLRGALLAKGRFIPAQFIALFKDTLYMDLARHANKMAQKLTNGLRDLGYTFLTDSPTNQIFPIFSHENISKLKDMYGFYVWSSVDTTTSSIRLVTSWATKEEAVDGCLTSVKSL